MISKPVVLLGSSRKNGETHRAVDIAFAQNVDCLDLLDYKIGPYDYNYANKNDDFFKIIDRILPRQTIVFATPVYWYAMSSHLKVFFDRLSDLVRVEKQKGRALAGKDVWLIVTGTDEYMPEGFEVPFVRTCEYLNMHYCGASYLYTHTDLKLRNKTEISMKEFGIAVTHKQTKKT